MARIERRGKLCFVRYGRAGCISCGADVALAKTVLARLNKMEAILKTKKAQAKLKKALNKEGGK